MRAGWKKVLKIIVLVLGILFVGRYALRFPWKGTYTALLETNLALLSLALVVNLTSLIAKGWAWHLLLNPLAKNRWRSAQEANLIGATVNCLSVSVAGEAARIHQIVKREEVPLQKAIISVIAERTVEGAALAFFLILASLLIPLPPGLKGCQVGAVVFLAIALALLLAYHRRRPSGQSLHFIRTALSSLAEIGNFRRLFWPFILSLFNWLTQWMTFHLVLVATNNQPKLAASLAALLVTNLAGFLRLTPANIGIFQASMILSLSPFGITSPKALIAGLVLQASQVFPVVLAGLLLIGSRGLKQMKSSTDMGTFMLTKTARPWPASGTTSSPISSSPDSF
jgi:uncharacterized membrane protein YbhN (UPF0104 family)